MTDATSSGCKQVAMGAKHRGASKIIGVDLNPKKFEIGFVSLGVLVNLNLDIEKHYLMHC